jgi:hypothetical protein
MLDWQEGCCNPYRIMENQNRILVVFVLLTTGISAQQVSVPTKQAASRPAMGDRDKAKEDQVAKLFETIRADAKIPQLKRIRHRADIEERVCTVALTGVRLDHSVGNTFSLYKTLEPESISPELKQVALFEDFNFKNGRYPRYSVAVWRTKNPQTGDTVYWVGAQRYWSAVEEFVDYHLTDDVFYHEDWKKNVAPECRGK